MSMHFRLPLIFLFAVTPLAFATEKPVPAQPKNKAGSGTVSQWTQDPKTPETTTWLAQRLIAAQANGHPEIAQKLKDLLHAGNVTAPCAEDGSFFFTMRGPGEKQASIYRRRGVEGKDERLVDAQKLGAGKKVSLEILDVATDGSLLVYGIGEGKGDDRTVRVFDVNAGHDLPDVLPPARYHTASIAPDKKGFYYSKVAPAGTRIFFHPFAADAATDKYVFGETYNYEALGPKDLISTKITDNGEYLLLSVRRGGETKRVDVYSQEQDEPDQRVRPIIHAMNDDFVVVNHEKDLFVLTDNAAPKKRVIKLMIDDPTPEKWEVIVPEGEDALSGIDIVGEQLFVTASHAGAARTRIFTLEGKEIGQITSPALEFSKAVFHACSNAEHE